MRLILPSATIEYITPDALKVIEQVGRTCYKSEDKISYDSAESFVKKIVANGHHAMLEHASARVRIICDRGSSHQLVRHRLSSFAQESMRYVNYARRGDGQITFIIPAFAEGLVNDHGITEEAMEVPLDLLNATRIWYTHMNDSERRYQRLITHNGLKPEDARGILPHDTKTEMIITTNLREWRHILTLRCEDHAQKNLYRFMRPLLTDFQKAVPVVFDDITY